MATTENTQREEAREVKHVTLVGLVINILLGVAKIAAGVLGRSGAMVADGIHSFSDLASDVVVIVMVGVSRHKPDDTHPFGHGKYETMSTVLLAIILILVGAGICWDGLSKILDSMRGEEMGSPGAIALIFCVLSIVSKEWLYHYTRRVGQRIGSPAVIANA